MLSQDIWSEQSGVTFLILSRLNQDPLEHLFYLIRSRGGTNNNPMLFEFNAIISKMLSMKVITSKTSTGNCEPNEDMLINVIQEAKDELAIEIGNEQEQVIFENLNISFKTNEGDTELTEVDEAPSTSMSIASENALRYFTGFLLYKAQQKYN